MVGHLRTQIQMVLWIYQLSFISLKKVSSKSLIWATAGGNLCSPSVCNSTAIHEKCSEVQFRWIWLSVVKMIQGSLLVSGAGI